MMRGVVVDKVEFTRTEKYLRGRFDVKQKVLPINIKGKKKYVRLTGRTIGDFLSKKNYTTIKEFVNGRIKIKI